MKDLHCKVGGWAGAGGLQDVLCGQWDVTWRFHRKEKTKNQQDKDRRENSDSSEAMRRGRKKGRNSYHPWIATALSCYIVHGYILYVDDH
jgi:hypothetical protein